LLAIFHKLKATVIFTTNQ